MSLVLEGCSTQVSRIRWRQRQEQTDAEQQHGMPAEDCREALGYMASENLKEVEVGGEGSCLFLAVKCAMRGQGASMSAAQLRENSRDAR